MQATASEVEGMANGWVERLRSLGQSRQAAAELLRRVGERPPSGEHEKLSFWVVSWRLLSPWAVCQPVHVVVCCSRALASFV